MKTMEEMRVEQETKQKEAQERKKWMKEKVLVASVEFPDSMKKYFGIGGFHMRLSELHDFLEQEFQNENTGTFKIKIIERTNMWVENLPEADI